MPPPHTERTKGLISRLRSHKLLAVGLVLALLVILVVAIRYGDSIRQYLATPPIQLTSTDVKDTYKPTVNLAFWRYRQDFGDIDGLDGNGNRKLAWTGIGVSRERNAIDQAFGKLRQSGVRAVVWFLFADGAAAPDFDKNGFVIGLDQSFVNDYKTAVEIAEENDVAIIWVLIDHEWVKPKETGNNGALLYGHADVIEDAQKRRSFFEKALKPLLQMYPTNKHIAGWIVVNEPEVALEQGYVSEENLSGFIRETCQTIRENTRQQPVSVGHLDLESLLKYHRDHKDIEFDFYAFHHYKTYMPPAVAQIRKQMGEADNKPIYIGEFSLNVPSRPRPVSDLRQFAKWSRLLGYAGVWPWAVKPFDNEPPKFQDITDVASLIEESRQQSRELDEGERNAWLEHAKHGIETVNLEIERRRSDMAEHNAQILLNRASLDRTVKQLAHEKAEYERETRVLAEANEAHRKNIEALKECRNSIEQMSKLPHNPSDLAKLKANERDLNKKIYEANGTEQWVKSASENLERRKREINNQEQWLQDYARKVKLNGYQSTMKNFGIQLAQPLYLDYWREEVHRASSTDKR